MEAQIIWASESDKAQTKTLANKAPLSKGKIQGIPQTGSTTLNLPQSTLDSTQSLDFVWSFIRTNLS